MKVIVDQVIAILEEANGGSTYPPIKVSWRIRRIIRNYIQMGRSAQEIAKTMINVHKAATGKNK